MEEEMGEMPLKIRNVKLMLYYKYWVHLQGNISANSAKSILQECWEHNQTSYYSGWIGKVQTAGLTHLKISLTVSLSVLPPWRFFYFLRLQEKLKRKSKRISATGQTGVAFTIFI